VVEVSEAGISYIPKSMLRSGTAAGAGEGLGPEVLRPCPGGELISRSSAVEGSSAPAGRSKKAFGAGERPRLGFGQDRPAGRGPGRALTSEPGTRRRVEEPCVPGEHSLV